MLFMEVMFTSNTKAVNMPFFEVSLKTNLIGAWENLLNEDKLILIGDVKGH